MVIGLTNSSGRISAALVIEYKTSWENIDSVGWIWAANTVGQRKRDQSDKSLSKDLEGMYAKVMKENELSKTSSQNSSTVPLRKDAMLKDGDRLLVVELWAIKFCRNEPSSSTPGHAILLR